MKRLFPIRKTTRWQWLFTLALSALLFVIAIPGYAATTPQQDLQKLDGHIEQALVKAKKRDFNGAQSEFKIYNDTWFDVEDGVKQASRKTYKEIEAAMGEVKFAFSIEPPNQAQVVQSLTTLHKVNQQFITNKLTEPSSQASSPSSEVTIASLIDHLNQAKVFVQKKDLAAAATEIKTVQTNWLEVEGIVATKSKQDYITIENDLAKAYGFLNTTPTDINSAQTAIDQLKQTLQPYANRNLRYTLLDAASILLREGLEALLVLVALLAFMSKSGNADKSRWLWIGAGAGVLASILTAIVIRIFFANLTTAGASRELLEGITGIVAASMLFYVSYWLHSKSSLGAWQGYIHHQATSALAKNSVFSLALLAFLAVFREGGETALFYIGIAPSISNSDLLGGLALGSVILVIVAVLIFGVGLKIPLKPFFLVTSVLIYYLGFKFIGSGIHALQVAGILPASPANFFPSWETLGLYPTWETTLAQLVILLIALAIVLRDRLRAADSAV